MDVERAKNDIIYFAENVLGFSLEEWHKDLLRKYEQGEIILNGNGLYGTNLVKETIIEHKNRFN